VGNVKMNKKTLWLILGAFLMTGCVGTETKLSMESCMDYASKLKDLSQTVDGYVKFGEPHQLSGNELLHAAANPDDLSYFADYQLKVDQQEDNVVLLLCNGDSALMEDAGCNASLDKHYCAAQSTVKCSFTLSPQSLCD
jgi:outer membrane lipoprotein-sorting protein